MAATEPVPDETKETPQEFGLSDEGLQQRWTKEITRALEKHEKGWRDRAKRVNDKFNAEKEESQEKPSLFHVLWSNFQTIQPVLYAHTPKPQVERKWRDRDELGRAAAQILERAAENIITSDVFDPAMENARDDALLPGRGQVWVRFIPRMQGDELIDAELAIEHVDWLDYLESPARSQNEVTWRARRSYLRKDKFIDRFGEKKYQQSLATYPQSDMADDLKSERSEVQETFKKIQVWEIWDLETRSVYWWTKGAKTILDKKRDPLGLHKFFPCPNALIFTRKRGSNLPIPEFCLWQDLAEELDVLTAKILLLEDAICVRGGYPADCDELAEMLIETDTNKLFPFTNYRQLADLGGLEKAITWLPLKQIIEALDVCYQARKETLQAIYEITGWSDIMRGATDAQETATAQKIKGQFVSQRLRDRQKKVQIFAKELIQICAEIIAEHFPSETVARLAGIQIADDPQIMQNFQRAMELLKEDQLRNYRIDIETDSTLTQDEEEDRQARMQFLEVVGKYMQSALQIGQQSTDLIPLLHRFLLFGTRGFRIGRELESAIEEYIDRAKLEAQKPKQEAPDPAIVKAQAEVQKVQAQLAKLQQEIQLQQQKFAEEIAIKQKELDAKLQTLAFETQTKAEIERAKAENDMAIKRDKAMTDVQAKITAAQTNAVTQAINPPVQTSKIQSTLVP